MNHAVFALDKEIFHLETCIKNCDNYIEQIHTNIEHLKKGQKESHPQLW